MRYSRNVSISLLTLLLLELLVALPSAALLPLLMVPWDEAIKADALGVQLSTDPTLWGRVKLLEAVIIATPLILLSVIVIWQEIKLPRFEKNDHA